MNGMNINEIAAAIGLLMAIVGSWVNVRLAIANLQRDHLAIKERMLKIEQDIINQQKAAKATENDLWEELRRLNDNITKVLVELANKEDRRK